MCPSGRLVAAYDATELTPPYRPELLGPDAAHCLLLLFTDYLVVLNKQAKASISSRGLLALLDGSDVSREVRGDELSFGRSLPIDAFDITEMDGNKMIHIVPNSQLLVASRPSSNYRGPTPGTGILVYHFSGAYEGKAGRFIEDLTKSRIEGRYPEAERESQKWEVRSASGVDLTFMVAISEENTTVKGRKSSSIVTIKVNSSNQPASFDPAGPEIQATLSMLHAEFFKLEVLGPCNFQSKDHLTPIEFLPVLTKRCKCSFYKDGMRTITNDAQ